MQGQHRRPGCWHEAEQSLQHQQFPNAFDIQKVHNATTLGDIGRHYVSALYGFKDKTDYYTTQGSAAWIPKIRVPAVSISARDDPFMLGATLPHPEDDIGAAPVKLVYHDHGGHCGFVSEAIPARAATTGGLPGKWPRL